MSRVSELLKCYLWILILPYVLSNECVTYNFENDFETLFDPHKGVCGSNMRPWELSNYTTLNATDITRPSPFSEAFITPSVLLSCVSSFNFTMNANGVLELNIYMEGLMANQITILVQEASENSVDGTITTVVYTPLDPSFVPGWKNLRIRLDNSRERFQSYIVLMGMASAGSVVLVDSFRYIPPSMHEDDCIIYKERPPTIAPTDSTTVEETTVTESWTTDDNGQGTGSTVTDSWTTDDNGQGTGSTVTDSSTTDDNVQETGSTATDSWTTDDNGQETGSTVTDSWTTDNNGQGTGSTVTESWTTDSDDQGTDSTKPWTTDPTDDNELETGTTDPEEDLVITTPRPTKDPSFWNPFTITMVVVIALIVLFFICLIFYEMGKRKARRKIQPIIIQEIDYDNLPKPLTVPRVTKVYADIGMNPFRNSALQV